MSLLLALLLQASDKEADEAVRTYRTALAGADAAGRRLAAQQALETAHERVIKAVADLLTGDVEDVRIGVAAALAEVDHPASVDVLVHALGPNEKRPEVVAALCAALVELGWQSACPALEALLRRVGAEEVREILPPVLDALGRLGSATSIEPLLDLIRVFEGPRRAPWKGEKGLQRKAEEALAAVAGYAAKNTREFDDWWKANRPSLLAGARKIWWSKKTGERLETSSADKGPAEALLVSTRLTDPPAAGRAPKPKKKKKP